MKISEEEHHALWQALLDNLDVVKEDRELGELTESEIVRMKSSTRSMVKSGLEKGIKDGSIVAREGKFNGKNTTYYRFVMDASTKQP